MILGRPVALLLGLALAGCATETPWLSRLVEPGVERIALADWDYDELRGGLAAETLIGAEALGPTGQAVGEVEDLIIGPDGLIRGAIIETSDTFLDIGGARASVPWRAVEIGRSAETVWVPITRANIADYGLFRNCQATATGPRTWRATELLNDYVRLAGAVDYGWVDDLIFRPNGELAAVVVAPDLIYRAGPYAIPFNDFPFNDFGFDPGLDVFELPYTFAEVGALDPFDPGVLR